MARHDMNPGTPGADLVGYLTRYPKELTFGDDDPAALMDRYHTPEFDMINDGIRLDRDRLLAHVRAGRKNALDIEVVVHDAVTEEDHVAARYTLSAVMRKRGVVTTDVFMFGRLAPDGRLRRVEQLTRTAPAVPVEPPQPDQ
jgi:hypothetical protein